VSFFNTCKTAVLDLIFPPLCGGCDTPTETLGWCAECSKSAEILPYILCPVCSRRAPEGLSCRECKKKTALAGLIAPFHYSARPIRETIWQIKYRWAYMYTDTLAREIERYLREHTPPLPAFEAPAFLFVPVPLAAGRLKERGFNQALLLASSLGKLLSIPVVADTLMRVRETKPQIECETPKERRENMLGAFALRENASLKGKTILLVDDVYTSGATMNECARLLKEAGAQAVWGVAVARG
jgi:ComF family protein